MNDDNNEDNDPIAKALGVEAIEQKSVLLENMLVEAHSDTAAKDFEFARSNLYQLIDEGKDAIFKLAQIANSSQHPRSYEVYSKLMETIIQANKELLELQSRIREISAIDSPINEKAQTVNNNLFVGSTVELQKMIENLRK